MAAYTREIQKERYWQLAGANRGELSRECALALSVTKYLKFRFSWDGNSPGSELKQWRIFLNHGSCPSRIGKNAIT